MSVQQTQQAVEALAGAAFDFAGTIPAAAPFLSAGRLPLVATRQDAPCSLPVLRSLPEAMRNTAPTTAPLMAILSALSDILCWRQSYTAGDFGPAFLDRYGWTELIGLRGPIASETLALGLLMLGPDVDYPSHAHAAEELYVPLAGTASWQRGDEPPRSVRPGTAVHHPSWMPHAMRTGAEPLVALYLWRGEALDAKPRITAP